MRPQTVIEMTENLDDETMRILEKKLIGKHPNTYTMTKGLAEQVIRTKAVGLPVSIVRPSIVCAAYQEPFPGWVDNVCGITGFLFFHTSKFYSSTNFKSIFKRKQYCIFK